MRCLLACAAVLRLAHPLCSSASPLQVPTAPANMDLYMQFDVMDGVVQHVLPNATAFPARNAQFSVQFGAFVDATVAGDVRLRPRCFFRCSQCWHVLLCSIADAPSVLSQLATFNTALWSSLQSEPGTLPNASYVNYLDPALGSLDSGDFTYLRSYYGSNLQRLVTVKAGLDPEFVFRRPQGIPPAIPLL